MMESPATTRTSQRQSQSDGNNNKMAMYENITYRKQMGSLLLTPTRVIFKTTTTTDVYYYSSSGGEEEEDANEKTIKWSWKSIKKIQVNKGKIMIKFWSSVYEGKSVTFALESVGELRNLRLDVKRRLRECRRRVAARKKKAKEEAAKKAAAEAAKTQPTSSDTPTTPEVVELEGVPPPTNNKRASLTMDDVFNNKESMPATAPSSNNNNNTMHDSWMDESAMTIGMDESAMTIGMDESFTMYEASETTAMMDESALIWAMEDIPEEETPHQEDGSVEEENANIYAITEESNQELLEEEQQQQQQQQRNTSDETANVEIDNEEEDVPPLDDELNNNNNNKVPDLEPFEEPCTPVATEDSNDVVEEEHSAHEKEEEADEDEEATEEECNEDETETTMPDLKSFEETPAEEIAPVAAVVEETVINAEDETTLDHGEVQLDTSAAALLDEAGTTITTDGIVNNQEEPNLESELEMPKEATEDAAAAAADGSDLDDTPQEGAEEEEDINGEDEMALEEEEEEVELDTDDVSPLDEAAPVAMEEDIVSHEELVQEAENTNEGTDPVDPVDFDDTPQEELEEEKDISEDDDGMDAPVAMENTVNNDQDETNEDLEEEGQITIEEVEAVDDVLVDDTPQEELHEQSEEEDKTIPLHDTMDVVPLEEMQQAASDEEDVASDNNERMLAEQEEDLIETKEEEEEAATVVTETTEDIADYSGHNTQLALSKSEEDTTGSFLSEEEDDDVYDRFDVLVNAFKAADKEFGGGGDLLQSGTPNSRSRRHTLCLDDRSIQFARQHITFLDNRNLEPVSKLVEKFEDTLIGGGNKEEIQQINSSFESMKRKSIKRASMKRRASNFVSKSSFIPLPPSTTNTGAPSYVPSFKGLSDSDLEKENEAGGSIQRRRRASSFIPTSLSNKGGTSGFVPSFQGISESENENVSGISQRRRASFMQTHTSTGIVVQVD